jgi:hypothetical protein
MGYRSPHILHLGTQIVYRQEIVVISAVMARVLSTLEIPKRMVMLDRLETQTRLVHLSL